MTNTDGPDGEIAVRQQVEQWFIRRGVPSFGHYRSQALVPFLLPIVLLLFCFEVAALPWLDLDEVVAAVAPGRASERVRPLAAALIVLALLVTLSVALPAIRVVICWTGPPAEARPARTWRRRMGMTIRFVIRLLPFAALVVVLGAVGAFVPLDLWDAAVLSLLVLAALKGWEQGTGVAAAKLASLVCAAFVAWSLQESLGGDESRDSLPESVLAASFGLIMLFGPVRGEPRLLGRREASASQDVSKAMAVPLLLVLVGVQSTIVPYLQSDTVAEAVASWLLGLVVPIGAAMCLAWRIGRRLDRGPGAALDPGPTWGTAALIGTIFVIVPPALVPAIEDEDISDHLDVAVAMGVANVIGLLALAIAVILGLQAVAEWMTGEFRRQVKTSIQVFRNAGPFIVIFIFFFFFTAEAWHVAAKLTWAQFAGLLLLQLAAAVVIAMGAMEQDLSKDKSWKSLKSRVPREVDELLRDRYPDDSFRRPLQRSEALNLRFILATKWILRMMLIGGAVALVLFLLGCVVMSERLLSAWQVEDRETWVALLAQVAAFLGAFAALYFAVEVARDPARRKDYVADFVDAVDRRLAVRLAYWFRFSEGRRPTQTVAVGGSLGGRSDEDIHAERMVGADATVRRRSPT